MFEYETGIEVERSNLDLVGAHISLYHDINGFHQSKNKTQGKITETPVQM